ACRIEPICASGVPIVRTTSPTSVARPVSRLAFENAYTIVQLDGGETVTAKCLLIATGADYRRLGVEGSDRSEGTGVYYAATLADIGFQGCPELLGSFALCYFRLHQPDEAIKELQAALALFPVTRRRSTS